MLLLDQLFVSLVVARLIATCYAIVPALFEYFYKFRKIWADQAHRQIVTF